MSEQIVGPEVPKNRKSRGPEGTVFSFGPLGDSKEGKNACPASSKAV